MNIVICRYPQRYVDIYCKKCEHRIPHTKGESCTQENTDCPTCVSLSDLSEEDIQIERSLCPTKEWKEGVIPVNKKPYKKIKITRKIRKLDV